MKHTAPPANAATPAGKPARRATTTMNAPARKAVWVSR
jgi:hypothetical protein